jgi:hypothetical protein
VSRSALAAFVVLVAATFAAFVVAQRLKGAPPVVRLRNVTGPFSPNGDHVRDVEHFSVVVRQSDSLTVDIVDDADGEVAHLASGVHGGPRTPVRLRWNGRADDGTIVPDGPYHVRVSFERTGRTVVVPKTILVDTRAPRPYVRAVAPGRIVAPGTAMTFSLGHVSTATATQVVLWRTDVTPAQRVTTGSAAPGTREWRWDGRVNGRAAPQGIYLAQVIRSDPAGNVGRAPARVPSAAPYPGTPGVTVRALAAQPPVGPVVAGSRVSVDVDSRRRPYSWRLTRVGSSRTVASGRHDGTPLTFTAPAGGSGLYVLRLQTRSAGTRVPILVQSLTRSKLLVVVPSLTWFGQALVDDDGKGQPDTLGRGGPADWPRVLPSLPAGFRTDVAPILEYLDRQRIRYDITSDLALALGSGPRPTDRPGVLLAGPETWITAGLGRRLRRYVVAGGRVASIAIGSLQRGVTVLSRAGGGSGELARPTPPVPRDPFGARLSPARPLPPGSTLQPIAGSASAPLLAFWDGTLTGFGAAEESSPPAPGDGLTTVAAVGVPPGTAGTPTTPRPAIAQERLGKGTIIRIGLAGWAQKLATDADVTQITGNAIDVLVGLASQSRDLQPVAPGRHRRHG